MPSLQRQHWIWSGIWKPWLLYRDTNVFAWIRITDRSVHAGLISSKEYETH